MLNIIHNLCRFANLIIYGDYSESMKSLVSNPLPKFTAAQSKSLKGSLDFLGINYYTTYYAESDSSTNSVNISYETDRQVTLTSNKNYITLFSFLFAIQRLHKY